MDNMEEVYGRHAKTVYKYLLSLTRDPELAEELTQETFFRAIKASERFNGSSSVATWLCAIAKKTRLEYLKKHSREAETAEAMKPGYLPNDSAEESTVKNAERLELLKRLHSLPEPMREVIYLRSFGGLSFRDIGAVHGMTENWARVTFYRGKEKLRKEYEKDGDTL